MWPDDKQYNLYFCRLNSGAQADRIAEIKTKQQVPIVSFIKIKILCMFPLPSV